MPAGLDYSTLLLFHCAATGFMVGVIWFVQMVHYPLFDGVGPGGFAEYAAEHQRRTSWVVAIPMLLEAFTCPWLLWLAPVSQRPLAWLLFVLLVGVWLSTWLQQVPRHRELLLGYDQRTIRQLVGSNAVRTLLWTAKGGVCLWLAARGFL